MKDKKKEIMNPVSNAEEEAYLKIKNAIRNKQILPKRKLVETTLAEILGMSRTPVRAAIKRLEYEGYVKSEPRRGAYLISPTKGDVEDTFCVRILLERKAIELATEKLTPQRIKRLGDILENESGTFLEKNYLQYDNINEDFHLAIAEFSDNWVLHRHIFDVLNRSNVYQLIFDHEDSNGIPPSIGGHARLLQLMKEGKTKEASDYMEEHIRGAMSRIKLDSIENNDFNDFLSL